MPITGRIFDIQRFSIHDGPGIRTTVFFKGCPMRCAWCHNPESIDAGPALSFSPDRCIGCGRCIEACPREAHRIEGEAHVLDRERCVVCGACADVCPAKALEIVGREATVDEVMAEVLADKVFYETSRGGMTLSGGEPTAQIEFCEALLQAARASDLHTCIETNGFCSWKRLERIAPLVDLFLYDCKETDPAKHREFAGVGIDLVMDNLRRLSEAGARIVLRCPIVPGLNDREEHFAAIRALVRDLPGVGSAEIMPYHRLGEGKLARFGLEDLIRIASAEPTEEQVQTWRGAVADTAGAAEERDSG